MGQRAVEGEANDDRERVGRDVAHAVVDGDRPLVRKFDEAPRGRAEIARGADRDTWRAVKDVAPNPLLLVKPAWRDAKLTEATPDCVEALCRNVPGIVGKPGKLGEHVRCVVNVSMLTEGWDASTVTHVLGIRDFGTQLLCEQVIGRALRRMSYAPNEEAKLEPEYADAYGVPFSFLPCSGTTKIPKPGPTPTRVRASPSGSPGRASWAIATSCRASGSRRSSPATPNSLSPTPTCRPRRKSRASSARSASTPSTT